MNTKKLTLFLLVGSLIQAGWSERKDDDSHEKRMSSSDSENASVYRQVHSTRKRSREDKKVASLKMTDLRFGQGLSNAQQDQLKALMSEYHEALLAYSKVCTKLCGTHRPLAEKAHVLHGSLEKVSHVVERFKDFYRSVNISGDEIQKEINLLCQPCLNLLSRIGTPALPVAPAVKEVG